MDANLLKWPAGNFDSTIDLKSNPAQIPDSFTRGDHPYSWSGMAALGPFKGLSAFSNNVHAQNSDALSQAELAKPLFGLDQEVYLGSILQKAASRKYRWSPDSKQRPSEFFSSVDPTPGVPGVSELVPAPSFPRPSLLAPVGLFASSPGYKFWQQNNAMAAWQNTLIPPPMPGEQEVGPSVLALGESTFRRAGCMACHVPPAYTLNRVQPVGVVGTEPSRAAALRRQGANLDLQRLLEMWALDTPVPLPPSPRVVTVPMDVDPGQIGLAWALGDSEGGYKIPSLFGLYWSTPYLHDGGVAVGKDEAAEVGLPGTILRGVQPDPENSLRALLDRDLRGRVVASNLASRDLQRVHVKGIGHEYWVDSQAGFSAADQRALIRYLLTLRHEGQSR